MQTADLVVVGAGIAGASAAFFAARAGLRVAVLDQSLPASGATGRTAGYIRCHYANPAEAHFAREGWRMHRQWKDIVGGDNGFRQIGFLFIVPPALVSPLRKNVEILARAGVPTRVVDADELGELQPFMQTADVGAAAYEPESGYADPGDCVGSLLAGVRAHGGRVLTDVGPAALVLDRSRVVGVRTAGDVISAPHTLVAGGAGTRALLAPLGVDLPVFPMPIGAGLLHRAPGPVMPMCVIDHAAEHWYRGEIGDALVVGAGYEDSIGFRDAPRHGQAAFAPPVRDELIASATRLLPRIPDLESARPGPTWVGVDSRTPDGHALAGPVPGVEGLLVLTGGNGKGFKFGPPMGQALAEVVTGRPFAQSPLAAFGLDRLASGREIRGEHEYEWGSFA